MKHELLITEFLSTPWAVLPERLEAMAGVIARWANDRAASPEVMASVRADAAAIEARRGDASRAGNGAIAVIPFYGVSVQRADPSDISGSGVQSIQKFTQAFRTAMADDSIGGILIDIDSPGGSVYGVQELGDEIYRARGSKTVVAIANSLAASAAYWIGSSAGEFYVTPGGEAGSIGVFAAHQDISKALDAEGVTTTLVSAGKYKTEGNPYGPLDDEARAYMQQRIDAYYASFTRAVARNRGTNVDAVRNGMGQGRVLGAADAKQAGMVDDVATFDQVLQRMARTIRGGSSSKAAAMRRDIDILSA